MEYHEHIIPSELKRILSDEEWKEWYPEIKADIDKYDKYLTLDEEGFLVCKDKKAIEFYLSIMYEAMGLCEGIIQLLNHLQFRSSMAYGPNGKKNLLYAEDYIGRFYTQLRNHCAAASKLTQDDSDTKEDADVDV